MFSLDRYFIYKIVSIKHPRYSLSTEIKDHKF